MGSGYPWKLEALELAECPAHVSNLRSVVEDHRGLGGVSVDWVSFKFGSNLNPSILEPNMTTIHNS